MQSCLPPCNSTNPKSSYLRKINIVVRKLSDSYVNLRKLLWVYIVSVHLKFSSCKVITLNQHDMAWTGTDYPCQYSDCCFELFETIMAW